ncbi:MAG: cation:dicarboxylate symporter family transporter, partial [Burkholderiales bacterium]
MTTSVASPAAPGPARSTLYLQVLVAIVAGALLGYMAPGWGEQMKPLGDAFIKLVRMLIAPIIFTTVVVGLAGMGDLRKVGRVGLKAVVYFEAATTLALIIGLVVVNLVAPGAGIHAHPASLDTTAVSTYTTQAKSLGTVAFLLNLIPATFAGAFSEGDILQVLVLALLFGVALSRLGEHARPVVNLLHDVARVFFGIVEFVTRLAPIAAFGAMAFTIGKYGLGTLVQLGQLMACVYLTCLVFIFGGLGLVARLTGFSLWRLLKFIKEELLIVLGTSSSEAALPGLMRKLEEAGCA